MSNALKNSLGGENHGFFDETFNPTEKIKYEKNKVDLALLDKTKY